MERNVYEFEHVDDAPLPPGGHIETPPTEKERVINRFERLTEELHIIGNYFRAYLDALKKGKSITRYETMLLDEAWKRAKQLTVDEMNEWNVSLDKSLKEASESDRSEMLSFSNKYNETATVVAGLKDEIDKFQTRS